jgi:hypothetical protein
MRIASGVEFSESSVIVDVAMEDTALFSSWITFEKRSNNEGDEIHTKAFLTASYGSSRHRSRLRFHISASFLKLAPGNHHGKWITVSKSHPTPPNLGLIQLTERYQVEYAAFCLGHSYALKCRIRKGNDWVIPWGYTETIRD